LQASIKFFELTIKKIKIANVNGRTSLISKGLKARVDNAPLRPKNIYDTKGAL